MELKLSDAYRVVQLLAQKSGSNKIDLESLKKEISRVDCDFNEDLNKFNVRVKKLLKNIEHLPPESTMEDYIYLRVQTMNLQSYFYNLLDALDEIAQKTKLYKDPGSLK